MPLSIDDLTKIKEIVVDPISEKVDEIKKELYDFKVDNSLCHKEMKAEIIKLNLFKGKVLFLGGIAGTIFGAVASYVVSRFTNGK